MPPSLYPFQKAAVERMQGLSDVLLFDDMGLGKSLQVIETIQRQNLKPALILPPKTLVLNWKREIEKWYPDEKIVIFETPDQFTDAYVNQIEDGVLKWFIMWHDALLQGIDTGRYLRDSIAEMVSKLGWKSIVVDEAHKFRNNSTFKTEALLKFHRRPGQKRFVLTGTPIVNSALDLYPLLKFVEVDKLPEDWVYTSLYTNKGQDGRATGIRNRNDLMELVGERWIRRTKAQVLKQLPQKTEQTMFLQMAPDQRKVYDKLTTMLMLELENGGKIEIPSGGAFMHLAMITRLRQLALDPLVLGVRASSVKTQAIWDLVDSHDDTDGKVVIYSNFNQYLHLLKPALEKDNFKCALITGEQTMAERDAVVQKFQNEDQPRVLLANMAAGGEGLNLTRADLVIIADHWWNKVRENQAIDRLHRIGQERQVTAVTLHVEDSVDDILAGVVAEKDANSRDLLIGLVRRAMLKNPELLAKLGISSELVIK